MHLVYRNFVSQRVGESFTIDDIVTFLQHQDVNMSKWSRKTIETFLDHISNTSLMCTIETNVLDGEMVYTVTSDNPAEFFLYSL